MSRKKKHWKKKISDLHQWNEDRTKENKLRISRKLCKTKKEKKTDRMTDQQQTIPFYCEEF